MSDVLMNDSAPIACNLFNALYGRCQFFEVHDLPSFAAARYHEHQMTYAQPSICNLTSTTVSQHKLSLPPKIQKSLYSHMLGRVLCPNYDDFIRKSFLLINPRGQLGKS